MKIRLLLVGALLLSVGFAPLASAGEKFETSCQDNPNQEGCTTPQEFCSDKADAERCEERIERQCQKDQQVKQCAQFIFEELCHTVVVHFGTPQLGVWDPLLGIIEIHEKECQNYYREHSDGSLFYLFTYERDEDGSSRVHRDYA